jgi:putative acetyltransferase
MVAVREETPADAEAIRRVNELAFGGAAEADIVEALRAAGAVTLSLVACDDPTPAASDGVVGHVLFSPVTITGAERVEAVGLGPMAVVPGRQRRGVGGALVAEGIGRLRAAGHALVVVLGHAAYYPRFGFERASRYGIRWEHPCPDEAFMVLALAPGALARAAGVARYRPELGGH